MLYKNELMIGDLVYYIHTEDGIAPYKEVIRIQAEDLCRDTCIIEAHYEPIPLTAEILEKNRFSGEGYYIDLVGFNVGPIPDGKDDYEVFIWKDVCRQTKHDFIRLKKDIKYVHELQHCLKLVGIDKEIVL